MSQGSISKLANTAFAAAAVDVAAGDGAPKTVIRLVPMGKIVGRDGRSFRLDDLAHAQAVVSRSLAMAGSTDIPIDYDHQIPFAVKDGVGGTAPASGWIKSLEAREDGIWATVEWTDAAQAKIRAREYRYISPFFGHEKDSGRLTRIWNAGLLNLPNFTELAAVAGADLEQSDMDLKAIAKALGLAEDATPEQIAVAATAAKAALDARPQEIADAVAAAKTAAVDPDPKAFVPIKMFTELRDQVATLQASGDEAAATAAVDAAVKAGKVTPAGREHALKLYKADKDAFESFVGAAAVVIVPGAIERPSAADLDGPLSAEEKAAAAAVGVTEEAYLASKKQLLGA